MNRLLILIVSLMFIPFGWSQQSLSLTEAIMEGLQNNRIMVNADYDIQIARERQWETLPLVYHKSVPVPSTTKTSNSEPLSFLGLILVEIRASITLFNLVPRKCDAAARLDQLIFDGSYLVGLQASSVFLKISRQNKVKSELEVKRLVTMLMSMFFLLRNANASWKKP